MAVIHGSSNDYLIVSPEISTSLQKYSLWAKARKDGNRFLSPSLDLDFAGNKSLIDNVSGSNLVTFTRSSNATFVGADGLVGIATTNTPRFDHNPLTGVCNGLLVEESRSNLLRYTNDIGNVSSPWLPNASGITAISNNAISPDGQLTATFVRESSLNEGHYIRHSSGHLSSASTVHTYSAYLKPNGRRYVIFFCDIGSQITRFDLLGPTSSTNVDVGNGWRRVSFQYTSASSSPGNNSLFIGMEDASYSNFVYISNAYTGDGTSGIYVWGAQCEVGSFPTSYIPTSGSTVTRSADVASITGTNFSRWYNQSEGAIFSDANPDKVVIAGTRPWDLTYPWPAQTWLNSTGVVFASAGSGISSNPASGLGKPSKTIVGYNAITKECSGSAFGIMSNTPVGTVDARNVSALYIGRENSGAIYLNSTIRRLTYWPTRLPNANLQLLTQ